jgi:hypothetical protein
MFALRWLLGAILLAWTIGLAVGAIGLGEYTRWVVGNVLSGALMAAVGVRCSLSLPTATRAMTWTIALWLASAAVVAVLALTLISVGMLCFFLLWLTSIQLGLFPPNTQPWSPISFGLAWPLATNAVTVLIAALIIVETRLRFDRIAGRMAGGAVEAAVDNWLYGQPGQPVRLDGRTSKAVKPRVPLLETVQADDTGGWPDG